ncbi:MAG: stage II sporulation protein P [Bacillota bacterium]
MEIKRGKNVYEKHIARLADALMILLAFIAAAMVGIQFGNAWYKLDINIVERIETDNFKNTIDISFPIIETVYNSGKSSVSVGGEIKALFTGIFGFDLESPVTILNIQSPVFMEYYNRVYRQEKMYGDNVEEQDGPGADNRAGESAAGDPENAGKSGVRQPGGDLDNAAAGNSPGNDAVGAGDKGYADGSGTGANTGKGQDASEKTGDGAAGEGKGSMREDGQPGGGADQAGKQGGAGSGTESGKPAESSLQAGSGETPTDPLQPISSIAYEVEEEDDEGKSDTVAADKIVVKNFTNYKIDIEKLLREPIKLDFSRKGPKVLVYHTHTSESYVLKESDLGKKGVPSFNSDPRYNVVRVGEELARHLKKYGIETLHNGTVHDKVRNAAYGVSIDTLNSYKKSHPSIKVFIDVHRDASAESKPKLRLTKKINGKNAAQIMFVVGTDGILPHPEWKENLKFVLRLQQKLNEKYPGLARPVWVVGKRYNQQISNQAILVEIGGDGNLLSECLESTKYLAEVLNDVMMEGK